MCYPCTYADLDMRLWFVYMLPLRALCMSSPRTCDHLDTRLRSHMLLPQELCMCYPCTCDHLDTRLRSYMLPLQVLCMCFPCTCAQAGTRHFRYISPQQALYMFYLRLLLRRCAQKDTTLCWSYTLLLQVLCRFCPRMYAPIDTILRLSYIRPLGVPYIFYLRGVPHTRVLVDTGHLRHILPPPALCTSYLRLLLRTCVQVGSGSFLCRSPHEVPCMFPLILLLRTCT